MFSNSYNELSLEIDSWGGVSNPDLPTILSDKINSHGGAELDRVDLLVCGMGGTTLKNRTHGDKYHTYGAPLSEMIDSLEKVHDEFRNPFYWAEQADIDNPSMLVYDLSQLEPAYNKLPEGYITKYGQRFLDDFGVKKLDFVTYGVAQGNLDPATLFGVHIQFV